jgi:hypothetical protein
MKKTILASVVLVCSVVTLANSSIEQVYVDDMQQIAVKVNELSKLNLNESPGPVVEVLAYGSTRFIDSSTGIHRACWLGLPMTKGSGLFGQIFRGEKGSELIEGSPFNSGKLQNSNYCQQDGHAYYRFISNRVSKNQYADVIKGMSVLTDSNAVQKMAERLSLISESSFDYTYKNFKIVFTGMNGISADRIANYDIDYISTKAAVVAAKKKVCTLQVKVNLDTADAYSAISIGQNIYCRDAQ